MSTTTFNWAFTMSDGSVEKISSSIDDILFSGDEITNCVLNIKDAENKRFSASVPLTYFLDKIYDDENISAIAGNLIQSLVSNSQENFKKYYDEDISSITDVQWINLLSNSIINVTPSADPDVDYFTGYDGKFTFVVLPDSTSGVFYLKFPQINSNGTISDTIYTLSSGDSITIYGTTYNSEYGYTVLSNNIKSGSNIVTFGDLTATDSAVSFIIPNIRVKFSFNRTANGIYNCIVSSVDDSLSNVDIRRYSIWNGGSVETFTLNDGTLTSVGTNIDTSVYGDSQDVSTVLVCSNSITWKITYWSSAKASRFRAMAEPMFK